MALHELLAGFREGPQEIKETEKNLGKRKRKGK